MTDNNKFFEDFIKLSGSAMNVALNSVNDMKKHFDEMVQQKIDDLIIRKHLVSRDEFDVLKAQVDELRNKKN